MAAAAMGIDTIRLKLLAFAIGAFLAGAAGTVNAHVTTQVSPDSYTFLESILLVAAVVLGGMGTVPGALLGLDRAVRPAREAAVVPGQAAPALRRRPDPDDALPARGHRPQPAPAAGAPRRARAAPTPRAPRRARPWRTRP